MAAKTWAREMARYNQWQNETLFAACEQLTNEARKADRGMFFGSIHQTLDHILMTDKRLLSFVVNGRPGAKPFEPAKLVYTDYKRLKSEREEFDRALLPKVDRWAETWLNDIIIFRDPGLGRRRIVPRMFYLMQLFNHGTHHRAQVTSELHKLGVDYGSTDLPDNPNSLFGTAAIS
jgi:uncharacterized damage-inducible protein DinB